MPPYYRDHPDTQQGILEGIDRNTQSWVVALDRAGMDPGLALRAAQLHAYYGNSGLNPGGTMAMAQEGFMPGSPEADAIAREAAVQDLEAQGDQGGLLGGVGDVFNWTKRNTVDFAVRNTLGHLPEELKHAFRASVRGAMAAFETGWNETVGRPIRTTIASMQDQSIGRGTQRLLATALSTMPGTGGLATGLLADPEMRRAAGAGQTGALIAGGLYSQQPEPFTFNEEQVYENYKRSGESPLTSAIRERIETGNFNVGSGYFIGEEALDRSIESNQLYLPNGDKITIGRAHAQMFEPGTTPYNLMSGLIDAAVVIGADPANIALGGAANIADARRAFKLPNTVRSMDDVKTYFGAFGGGHRLDVDVSKNVNRFLNEERAGRELVQHLAGDVDPENIWQILGRHPYRGVVDEVVKTSDPEEVKAILGRELGITIRERPRSVREINLRTRRLPLVRRSHQDMRLMDEIPGRWVNIENLDETLETFNQYLKNANLSPLDRKRLFGRYVALRDGDIPALDELMKDVVRKIDARIEENPRTLGGAAADTVAKLTGRYKMLESVTDEFIRARDRFEAAGRPRRDVWTPQFDGIDIEMGKHAETLTGEEYARIVEEVGWGFPLPDFREIRRATSNLAPLLDAGVVKQSVGLLESYMTVWKPLQLLRLAWTVRVVGEEQVRLAGQGLSSPFRNPADWITWTIATADDSRLAKMVRRVARTEGKGQTDILGQLMKEDEAFRSAMSSKLGAWMGEVPEQAKFGHYRRLVRKGKRTRIGDVEVEDADFNAHFLSKLQTHVSDELSQKLAQGDAFTFEMRGRPAPTRSPGGNILEANGVELAEFKTWFDDVDLEDVLTDLDDRLQYSRFLNEHSANAAKDAMLEDVFSRLTGGERVDDGIEGILTRRLFERAEETTETLTGMDAVKAWLRLSDEGRAYRQAIADAGGTRRPMNRAIVDDAVARDITINGEHPFRNAAEVSDYFVEAAWADLNNIAGRDEALMQAVATGVLDGVDVANATLDDINRVTRTLKDHLDAAPEFLVGPTPRDTGSLRDFANHMFDMLMSARTDTLSRSPAFRQFYYQRVQELMPRVDGALREDILIGADRANIGVDFSKLGQGDVVITDLQQLDAVAKQYALEETRKLLYDMDRRGQWSDIARNIMPFAEAWKEVLGTWFRLLRQRPQNIRRAQQVITGARGHDNDPSTGFFFTDPDTGQEKFAYPLVGRAMSGVLGRGANLSAQGEVQNLNLVTGSLLPGFGPIAALGASAILPDTPDWDWARDALLPFGEERIEGSMGEWLEHASLPAWFEKSLIAAFGDDRSSRQFANTRMALVQSMINSGRYEPHEIEVALDESRGAAKMLYFLRSVAQFGLPTGPIIEHELEDRDGRYHQIGVLASEFRAMAEEAGSYDAAIPLFIENYGIDPFLISQPTTRTIKERSFTGAGWAWERTNADHLNSLNIDHVVGYFAPIDVDDESFAYEAWVDARTKGHSVDLTSEQQALLYNSAAGMFQYRAMKDRLESLDMPEDERRLLLKQFRSYLRVTRPGFDTVADTLPSRPDYDVLIEELKRGAGDAFVGGTPAGQAIAAYLTTRDNALAVADGVSLEGERDAYIRWRLHQYGQQVVEAVPEFEKVWLEVFSREVNDAADFMDKQTALAEAG